MKNQKESMLVLGFVFALVCVTNSLPTRHLGKSTNTVARLTDILSDLRTIQERRGSYSDDLASDLVQKRKDARKQRESFDLLIQLNDPVKIQEVPKIKGENSLSDDVMSGVNKRQGGWDLDYGLGGGRFGKRGYDDYHFGGGRFGRDVDHVDLNSFDD